jgi:hypothetical protein
VEQTIYVCTHTSKETGEDTFDGGEIGRRNLVWDMDEIITADTIEALLALIRNARCVPLDEIIVTSTSLATFVAYERLETSDGGTPARSELKAWRAGKMKLYGAHYCFRLERHTVTPVPLGEFAFAGVKITLEEG